MDYLFYSGAVSNQPSNPSSPSLGWATDAGAATKVGAYFYNAVYRELGNIITAGGGTNNANDFTQVVTSIQTMINARGNASDATASNNLANAINTLTTSTADGVSSLPNTLTASKAYTDASIASLNVAAIWSNMTSLQNQITSNNANLWVTVNVNSANISNIAGRPYIIAQSIGMGGWRKYSDGTIYQWGYVDFGDIVDPGGGNGGTINYYIPMTAAFDAKLTIQDFNLNSGSPWSANSMAAILDLGTSSITFGVDNYQYRTENVRVYWSVWGIY